MINFLENILWSADREKFFNEGYTLSITDIRLKVSIGPEFKMIQPFECIFGIIYNAEGRGDVFAIPCDEGVVAGTVSLVGTHWTDPVCGDYFFVRLNGASDPVQIPAWEGPACRLTSLAIE